MLEITADHPNLWVICLLLVAVLGYFLRDAHLSIKRSVEEKASKDSLENLRAESQRQAEEWRNDLREDRARSQQELQRLEAQYEQKFAGALSELRNQITTLESHMKDRMDMILKLLERNSP